MTSWACDRIDLEVFGLDCALYHKYWSSNSWSAYENLGGVFIYSPAAVSLGTHKIHLFGIGSDSALWHKYYDPKTGWNPSGTGWTSLGGVCMTAPVVVKYGDDNVAAFVVGTDRACWACIGTGNDSFKWVSLKGKVTGDSITACSWASGRMDVFSVGADSALNHLWYLDGKWADDWENVGGVCIGKPKAICPRKDRIDVFVKGLDSAMYHLNWNGKWNWQRLGGVHLYEPDAVCWNENRIDVFSVSTDTNLTHVYADIPTNDPGKFGGDWEKLGGTCTSSPKALARSCNTLDVFIRGTRQQVLQKTWNGSTWGPASASLFDLGGSIISNCT